MDVWNDKQIQDQERTHPRNIESDAGFQKYDWTPLNWYGHVMRRDDEHILSKVLRTGITVKARDDDPALF